jgi:hypothetical protein
MLVENAAAADEDAAGDMDVSAKEGVIGNDHMVRDLDIVGQVRPGHQVIVIANTGGPALDGGAVDGAELADGVGIANDHLAGMIGRKRKMLRRGAEDGAMPDTVIVPEADPAREDGMRMET